MSDYIDRHEAIMAMRKTIWSKVEIHPTLDRDEVENVLFDMPSADVEPVRHGRWQVNKMFGYNDMTCSSCGWRYEYYDGLEEEWNYCPHCGARIDGEQDESN